jgi:hypothetical protein
MHCGNLRRKERREEWTGVIKRSDHSDEGRYGKIGGSMIKKKESKAST